MKLILLSNIQGIFSEHFVLNESTSYGAPKNVSELQDRSGLSEVDECGDVYVSLLDYETAEYDFAHYGEIESNATASGDYEGMMQMNGSGTTDSDFEGGKRRLGAIGWEAAAKPGVYWKQTMSKVTSCNNKQHRWGIITFTSDEGPASCSGTRIHRQWVLTAGHCCHSGKGGSWFSNYKWHPGALNWQRHVVSSGNNRYKYDIIQKVTFSAWVNRGGDTGDGYAYDICWLKVRNQPIGTSSWWDYGYSDALRISSFSFYGYPYLKKNDQYMKWGHSACQPTPSTNSEPVHLVHNCEAYKGMSGAGYVVGNKVICVQSHTFPTVARVPSLAIVGPLGELDFTTETRRVENVLCSFITRDKATVIKDWIAKNS